MEDLLINTADYSPPCASGKSAYTRYLLFGTEALKALPEIAAKILAAGRVALCFDAAVEQCAQIGADLMRKAGYFVDTIVTENGESGLELKEDVRLLVAMGGGSAANAVKIAATKLGCEWIYLMTCASSDSALYPYAEYLQGERRIAECVPPIAVIADEGAIAASPENCTAAGFGTLCSKLLVLFSLRCDELTEHSENAIAALLDANLTPFFQESSCENFAVRIARTLVRVGLIAQCCPEPDYLQREEYTAACTLSAFGGKKRLIGEDAMLATLTIALLYSAWLEHMPDNLFVPCGYFEDLRLLSKLCGADMPKAIARVKRGENCAKKLYVAREYRNEIKATLNASFGEPKQLIRRFKRIYGDVGFWMSEYITPDKLLAVVSLSAALLQDDSLLRAIKQSGLLDYAGFQKALENA